MAVLNYLRDVLGIESVVMPDVPSTRDSFKEKKQTLVVLSGDESPSCASLIEKMLGSVAIHDFVIVRGDSDIVSAIEEHDASFVLSFGVGDKTDGSAKVFELEEVARYMGADGDKELRARKFAAWELLKRMKREIDAWEI